MKYKLLVLDVDGTLLDSEKKISKRTLAALLKVQQMGVRIVLASAGPPMALCPLPRLWNWAITEASFSPTMAGKLSMRKVANYSLSVG